MNGEPRGRSWREKRDFLEDLVYAALDTRVGSRRFTQDSPVMPDVWIHYGLEPHRRHDLILTPVNDRSPGKLAVTLQKNIKNHASTPYHREFLEALAKAHEIELSDIDLRNIDLGDFERSVAELSAKGELTDEQRLRLEQVRDKFGKPRIAYNETTVAVKLWFHEMVQVLLPLTTWWRRHLRDPSERAMHPFQLLERKEGAPDEAREQKLSGIRTRLAELLEPENQRMTRSDDQLVTSSFVWLTLVAGTIARAAHFEWYGKTVDGGALSDWTREPGELVAGTFRLLEDTIFEGGLDGRGTLFSINRNRDSETAMYQSIPTIKADAARKVFGVSGADIRWAVVDSGIDARNWAFRARRDDGSPHKDSPSGEGRERMRTRVVKTYDFTKIRNLLCIEDADDPSTIPRALKKGRMIDWDDFEKMLRVPHPWDPDEDKEGPYEPPKLPHGTHVAGILAADWRSSDDEKDALPEENPWEYKPAHRKGVCPEMKLYDLRVVRDDGTGSEFAVMAALQFIRSLNARRDYVEIHGVNISISIRHEVTYYACGRTPVCSECERLVGAGTVVVAAAGNNGRVRFLTRGGADEEGYSSISITDPGNAEAVITVGATHRREPHSYGVSYFSSRGPTGDGRMKPDLVAPGEKICSTVPGNREEFMDGTSMAAPHVSGAAAMLMSRHPELVGNPVRIKKILCETATDLGRERYFQGAGLLDILRALQSI